MPCDYKKYPADWKEVRQRILARDWNCCKFCWAENGQPHWITGSIVVLTIAHLNHNIQDMRDYNLAALCQRCHNILDMPYRHKIKEEVMPVVSKREFFLPDQFGGRQFMKINFSSKNNLFSIKIPDAMAVVLKEKETTGASIDDVVKKFQVALEKFKSSKTIKTKVILVYVDTYHRLDPEDERKRDDAHVVFDFELANEYKFTDRPSYTTIAADARDEEDVNGYGCLVLPWSEENEKALNLIRDSFRKYADLLNAIVGPVRVEDNHRFGDNEDYKKTVAKILANIKNGEYKKLCLSPST